MIIFFFSFQYFLLFDVSFQGYGTNQYQGTIHALRHVFQTEGIQGLYRGTTACLLRDVPFSGIYYLFYSQLKQKSKLTFGDDLGPLFSLVNGIIQINSSDAFLLKGKQPKIFCWQIAQDLFRDH